MPTINFTLSERQVRVLQALLSAPENKLTQKQIVNAVGAGAVVALGPRYREDCGKHDAKYGRKSLVSMGYVEPREEITGTTSTVYFHLTDLGRGPAKRYRVLRKGEYEKVPADLLNVAVKTIKNARVYGVERFTREDLDAIRAALPSQYVMVPLEDIRTQIVNQRKQGAYADPDKQSFNRKMGVLKGMVRDYWSGQTSIDEIVEWLESQGEEPQ